MRNMSFALTTEQIRNRTKTVTRRIGWQFLKRGDLVRAVVKGMGLRKGETPEALAIIVIVSVRREQLNSITNEDVAHEGFPGMRDWQFTQMFKDHMCCHGRQEVSRIEFRYVPGGRLGAAENMR